MKIKDKDRFIARMLTSIAIASTITTAGLGANMLINKDAMQDNTPAENIAYQTAVTASGTICASSTMMVATYYTLKRKAKRDITGIRYYDANTMKIRNTNGKDEENQDIFSK